MVLTSFLFHFGKEELDRYAANLSLRIFRNAENVKISSWQKNVQELFATNSTISFKTVM